MPEVGSPFTRARSPKATLTRSAASTLDRKLLAPSNNTIGHSLLGHINAKFCCDNQERKVPTRVCVMWFHVNYNFGFQALTGVTSNIVSTHRTPTPVTIALLFAFS